MSHLLISFWCYIAGIKLFIVLIKVTLISVGFVVMSPLSFNEDNFIFVFIFLINLTGDYSFYCSFLLLLQKCFFASILKCLFVYSWISLFSEVALNLKHENLKIIFKNLILLLKTFCQLTNTLTDGEIISTNAENYVNYFQYPRLFKRQPVVSFFLFEIALEISRIYIEFTLHVLQAD